MPSRTSPIPFALLLSVAGCAGAALPSAPPAVAPQPSEPKLVERVAPTVAVADPVPTETTESVPEELIVPTACADPEASVCTPAPELASEICRRRSQDLALSLFKKASPWQRAYLRLDTEAWYTGARLSSPKPLELDEEVIVLVNRSGGSGVQVGGGSYDIYRWDGSCASVMADEVTFTRPRAPRTAQIVWERIGDELRDALLGEKGIRARRDAYRSRCVDDRTAPACTNAQSLLGESIVDYVRKGGEVPSPRLALR